MNYKQSGNKVVIPHGKNALNIEVFSPDIVRINYAPAGAKKRPSLVVTMKPEVSEVSVEETQHGLEVQTDNIKVVVNKKDMAVSFYELSGLILSELPGTRMVEPAVVSKEKTLHAGVGFTRDPDEGLYGLGQYEEGFMNYKNCDVLMIQANRVIVNPFLVSSRGYGILWDNYSESRFHSGDKDFSFLSEVADGIDYYLVHGGSMDGAVAQYRKLTGAQQMFPKWVHGFWQSKERYVDQDELVNIVKEYRKRKVPIDAVVQDWRYWGENEVFSGMIWNERRFPEPKRLTKELKDLNSHLMCSFWPALGPDSPPHKELKKKGYMLPGKHWTGSKIYDAFSEEARAIYWKHVKKCLFDTGVDAYWMDGTEAEFISAEDRFVLAETYKANGRNSMGTMARYLNAFSFMTTLGVYKNQRKVSDKKRLFILTRSAFAGQQSHASASWSGDTFAGWETLRNQVSAGLNFSMAGVPYWTSDVGAFYPFFKYKNPFTDPGYKELYLRWFQYVAFTPILRVHGTAIPRELWRFGEPGSVWYDTMVKFINLRYRTMPYVYSTAWQVTNEGYSFMRPLACDFPEDKKALDIGMQFMFGKSMMACPVTKELYEETVNKGDYIYLNNLFTPDGKENGLIYECYDSLDFTKLAVRRKLDTSSMGWAGNIPEGITREYSQRWTGKILSGDAGTYDFAAVTDGSLRIWFDGRLVVDAWDNREEKRFKFSVKLKADTKYSIKLEHQQFRMGQAIMRINWHTPAMKRDEAKKYVEVYLPNKEKWFDFWTGKTVKGGQTLKLKPALDIMPIYVPAGSIIPVGPALQYTTEKAADPIEVRVYDGADASFELYEDENDSYNYEKGTYSTIRFDWDNANRALTIGTRQGEFPGMLKARTFKVVAVKAGHGVGISDAKKADRVVKYNGEEVRVAL